MFRPKMLAIFREPLSFLACVGYVPTYMAGILNMITIIIIIIIIIIVHIIRYRS
jgi:hypothetical protein